MPADDGGWALTASRRARPMIEPYTTLATCRDPRCASRPARMSCRVDTSGRARTPPTRGVCRRAARGRLLGGEQALADGLAQPERLLDPGQLGGARGHSVHRAEEAG